MVRRYDRPLMEDDDEGLIATLTRYVQAMPDQDGRETLLKMRPRYFGDVIDHIEGDISSHCEGMSAGQFELFLAIVSGQQAVAEPPAEISDTIDAPVDERAPAAAQTTQYAALEPIADQFVEEPSQAPGGDLFNTTWPDRERAQREVIVAASTLVPKGVDQKAPRK